MRTITDPRSRYGAATASRPCWGWPRRPRCAAPGVQGDPRVGLRPSPAMLRHFRRVNGASSDRASTVCDAAPDELDGALRAWFRPRHASLKGAVRGGPSCAERLGAKKNRADRSTVRQAHQRDRSRDPVARTRRPRRQDRLAGALLQTAIASYLRKHDAHYMFVAKGRKPCSRTSGSGSMTTQKPPRFCRKHRQAHQGQAANRARTLGTARDLDHPRAPTTSCSPASACQVRKGRVVDTTVDTSWGVTSHTPHTADAQTLLRINGPEGPCIASSMTATPGTRTTAASAPAMGPRT